MYNISDYIIILLYNCYIIYNNLQHIPLPAWIEVMFFHVTDRCQRICLTLSNACLLERKHIVLMCKLKLSIFLSNKYHYVRKRSGQRAFSQNGASWDRIRVDGFSWRQARLWVHLTIKINCLLDIINSS